MLHKVFVIIFVSILYQGYHHQRQNGAHLSVTDGSTSADAWCEYAFEHTNKLLVKLHSIEGQCLRNTEGEAFV